MNINPGKSKAAGFTTARVKERIRCSFGDQFIPEANSFKYLRIIIRSDINWADHVNYTARKARRALHFIMCVLKRGKRYETFRLYGTIGTDT